MHMDGWPRARRVAFAVVVVAAALAGCGDGKDAAKPQAADKTGFAHQASDLKPDPAVRYGVMANGLRYALMPNKTPEGRVSVRYYVRAGMLHGKPGQSGVAHFLEHLAFNGSQDIPPGEMVELLQRHGLAFGADTNASTGFEQTIYQLDLPNNKPELIRIALHLMRETAFRLTLLPEEIDKERGVILSEKRVRNTAERRYYGAYLDALFPGAEIGARLNDSEEFIRTVSREDFEAFYRGFYTPERSFLVVTGDMDPDAVEPVLKEMFMDFKAPDKPLDRPKLPPLKPHGLKTHLHTDKDLPTFISFNVVRPYSGHTDNAATRIADIRAGLAFAMLNRRFETIAQRPDAPFLQASAGWDQDFEYADLARAFAVSSPEKWREALAVMEQEVRRAMQHGFTGAEFKEQAANLRKAAEDNVRAAGTRDTTGLAEGIIDAFDERAVFTHPSTGLELVEAALKGFTPEMAHQALRKRLEGMDKPLIMVAGNITLDDPKAEILAAHSASRKVAVAAPKEAQDAPFAYTDFGTPGKVTARARIEDLDVTQLTFANGVRVNLKPTKFEDDSVQVRVSIAGGLLTYPRDKDGLAFLAEVAFAEGGLGRHSWDDLQRITAGRTLGVSFSVEDEFFGLSGGTTPGDLELQLQMLAAYVTDPGYRPEGLQTFRQFLPIFFQRQNAQPQGVASLRINRIMRGEDVRFGFPASPEPLAALTLDDLKAWLAGPLKNGYMEITVVGDFDPAKAEPLLTKTFGALPRRESAPEPFEEADAVVFSDQDGVVRLTHHGVEKQALLRAYWITGDARDRKRSRALNVLARVLSDRLRRRVREEEGASYSPFAFSAGSLVFPGVGFIVANANVNASDEAKYLQMLVDQAGSLTTDAISEDELKRALTPILESLPSRKQDNGFWLGVLNGIQAYPDRVERIRKLETDYGAVTVAQLNDLAAEYLAAARARRFVVAPEAE